MLSKQQISNLLANRPNPKNQGFAWFWTLAILGVGGIGLAIIVPSFLNETNKICGGPTLEVRQYIGAINRSQQAYFLENRTFAKNLDQTGIGIKSKTENYQYLIATTPQAAFSYAISLKGTEQTKSYVGAVFTVTEPKNSSKAGENEINTIAIVCSANTAGKNKLAAPIYQNKTLSCGAGTTAINR